MVRSAIVRMVGFCTRHPWSVTLAAMVLTLGCAFYAATHFAITTDTEQLLPDNLPWRRNEIAYQKAFPQGQILAVVQAPTPEMADLASARLAAALQKEPDHLSWVRLPQAGEAMEHGALLFLPMAQLEQMAGRLTEAKPLIGALAADPTLRGVMNTIAVAIESAGTSHVPPALDGPMNELSDTLGNVFAGRFASFSWRSLLTGAPAAPDELRQFIEIEPKLDFQAMQPGHAATGAIRRIARDLRLRNAYGATLRLTGRVPINDAAFEALQTGALPIFAGTVAAVLAILWLALRSARIILAVFVALFAGLAATAAVGLLMLGRFNLISITFAVLFIGLGADFGIQFSVRYRAERHERDEVRAALSSAAEKAGIPLALAAIGTAVGFFSFLPTNYRGVAELGQIAGFGMLIAFFATITLLPALLTLFHPPSEPKAMGFAFLGPADRFLARYRIAFVAGTLAVVLAGAPLLAYMRFDFDPIHLQTANSEAVQTFRELSRVPATGMEAAAAVVPSIAAIGPATQKLLKLPEVAGVRSIDSLVPGGQDGKLALIRGMADTLRPQIDTPMRRAAPSDAATVRAIRRAAGQLALVAAASAGGGASARRLSGLLYRLAAADATMRHKAALALVLPLRLDLDRLGMMLSPQPLAIRTLPAALVRQWVAPDGEARIEILPKGNPNRTATLGRFARAVLSVMPEATGTPIDLLKSRGLVLGAFAEAAIFAVVAIAIILWIALRRISDVLLTLGPLIVAAAVTLELTVLVGEPLNFANVTALPLLLGVGVAFKIYYITAWRAGRTDLLQSTLTRAVFFSALTTATAFGSLWLSSQPGMSSMGELMALALLCTLFAAVLFQPALMGPPRTVTGSRREGDRL